MKSFTESMKSFTHQHNCSVSFDGCFGEVTLQYVVVDMVVDYDEDMDHATVWELFAPPGEPDAYISGSLSPRRKDIDSDPEVGLTPQEVVRKLYQAYAKQIAEFEFYRDFENNNP